jgi:hypothetical protein
MTSDKQLEANRQNALQSTGPRSAEGVEAVKNNALRHSLRSIQTVVSGEDPDAWEAHRAAVIEDVKPSGALELALAEQVAIKLWRLGRVVRFEADMIGNAQNPEELAHTREKSHTRSYGGPARTDIPTRKDVENARKEAEELATRTSERDRALRQLELLDGMEDEDEFEDWNLYEALKADFRFGQEELGRMFKGEDDGPFRARHGRKMILARVEGKAEAKSLGAALSAAWQQKQEEATEKLRRIRSKHKGLTRRYKAALERRRLPRGLPDDAALDKIQRYEAHLERGLHKALERLQTLQEARGANPTTINLAVVQGIDLTACNDLGKSRELREKIDTSR